MEQLRSSLEGFWLSPQQKRVWLLGRSGPALVCQSVLLVEGALDPHRLERALARVIGRHEIFRTTFEAVPGMALPLQVIAEGAELALREVDWSAGGPGIAEEEALGTLLRAEREAPFDLEDGPTARFCRIALGEQRHALAITLPALLLDAASLESLVAEIGRAYLAEGGIPTLQEQEETVQYIQFSEWQNEILSDDNAEGEAGRRFWRSKPEPPGPVPVLPQEKAAEAPQPAQVLRLAPSAGLGRAVADWSARHQVTESAVLLGAWWATLCRLSGSNGLAVAVRCHGRVYEEMLGALGLYERWPAVGGGLRSGFRFTEIVQAFDRELGEAMQWQELYESEAPENGAVPEGFGFDFMARSRHASFQAGPVRFSLLWSHGCADRFKLRLSAVRGPEGLALDLWFDPGLYDDATALRIAESFFALLAAGLAASDTPVPDLAVLGGTDLGLLALWNRTSCPCPAEERLHVLFAEQARRTPEALAVVAGDERLTFAALDHRANRIAWHLAALGIGPDDRVALCLERSADAIAALLGTLKAGGAYVPLDPIQPAERLAAMLSDSGARVVLSQESLSSRIPVGGWRIVLLDGERSILESYPDRDPEVEVEPENLAYVLYTSGSTGRPKGTLIQHRSVANLALALDRSVYRRLGDGPLRVSLNAPLYFDASVKQWVRLLAGDALAIVAEELRADGASLLDWLAREEVDVLDCTPSLLRLLLGAGLQERTGAPRALLVGGEAIDSALWETLAADPYRRFFNVYGPTECTVDVAVDEITAGRTPSIGRAIANVEVHVLDAGQHRQPLGLAGELCVAGAGLARGYLGRPDLTAEKFIPDPFGDRPGGRLYRTGDRVRFLPDGHLEFLGRVDHQVKLRGFRIELGEIEAALASHPDVGEAVVLLREDQAGQPRLVGYAVPKRRSSAQPAGRYRLPNGLSVAHQNQNETSYLYEEIFEKRCYALHGIELPDDACIFDVGANIGMFALFVHQECANPRLYAFEPIPGIFESLRTNCELYGQGARLFPFGLSDRERTERFAYYPRYSMMSSQAGYARPGSEVEVVKRFLERQLEAGDEEAATLLGSADELLAGRFELQEVEARLRRLSDVLREESIERIDLLKIDVQRAELDVLHGLDEEHWPRVDQVVMEVHDSPEEETCGRIGEIRAFLEGRGFQVVIEQDELLIGTDRYNLYAWRASRRRRDTAVLATAHSREVGSVAELTMAGLREHLQRCLPDYMVPAACVVLDEMPLTRNGKIDRRALPAPEEVVPEEARERLAPRTPIEEILVGIFANVLDIERPGADESFFDLGGHSLLATQLIARVRESFRIDLPLRVLFEDPTAAALGLRIEAALAAEEALEAPPLRPVPREGRLPLSFAQQRLWFLWQLEPDSPAYNNPKALRIRGPLEVAALAQTLSEIVRRHEILRTTFPAVQGEPVQWIVPADRLPLPFVDLAGLPAEERERRAHELFHAEARCPFDLAREIPVRAQLLRLDTTDHVLFLTFHHIACDAWSLAVLEREVTQLYEAFASGRPSALPELPVQYADFARWQRDWLQGEVLERQLAYWRGRLEGAQPVLELPLDRPRPAVSSSRGRRQAIAIPLPLSRALAELSQRRASTLFMTLLAGFQALLARLSGQTDVSVGTPIAGRRHVETEGLIGFFVNTLVLRGRMDGNPTFEELLGQARETALQAYAHQDLPFERLVDELAPQRNLAQTPLFQAMLALQNVGREGVQVAGLDLSPLGAEPGVAKFDLTLGLAEGAEGLLGSLEYRVELFDPATIARLGQHLITLLKGAVAEPKTRFADLPLLAPVERHQLLREWNDIGTAPGLSFISLFELQVDRAPDAPALSCRGRRLTYGELDRQANRLAHHLLHSGVGPEVRVAVLAERSPELIVAFLGILKAGGTYVPLDPAYPRERLAFMLEDAGAALLLTDGQPAAGLAACVTLSLRLEELESLEGAREERPLQDPDPDQLAYVIYTSGSTGRPKGGMVSFGALAGYAHGVPALYGIVPDDRVLQFCSTSFDASLEEIVCALGRGAELVLRTDAMLESVAVFLETCREQGITVLSLPTAYWHEIVAKLDSEALMLPPCLRVVAVGGERALRERVEAWRRHAPVEPLLLNTFGVTESTIVSTVGSVMVPSSAETRGGVSAGRSVPDTEIYLLDLHGGLVPAGVAGELHIGGLLLARGYLNRPDLTAERFVPHPFSQLPGARLYRTGDLARMLPSGEIEVLGRRDRQVKVRGYRIEIEEIEARLLRHPEVESAVVLVREDLPGDKRVVAYVVPCPETEPAAGSLREFLREQLPDYMLPSAFVLLLALPLNPNGKVDRRALPVPLPVAGGEEVATAARTPVEEIVAGIFAEVLGIELPGVEASFFELGGHSLLATRVIARVRSAFEVELPLRALFEAPTVAVLAQRIEAALQSGSFLESPPLRPAPRSEALPLSFAQQRLWFLWQLEPMSPAYNIPLALRIRGLLDVAALERALCEIVQRHEVLRTTFLSANGEPVQVVDPAARLALPLADLTDVPAERREELAQRAARAEARGPFDLSRELPVRAKLLRFGTEEHVLLLTFHHIVSDAWSLTVLEREMAALYEAFAAGQPSPLPDLPVQYADYAEWQREWLQGEVLERQLAFWRGHLTDAPPMLDLPLDRPRPPVASARGGSVPFTLPAFLSRALVERSRQQSATLFMTLLAGFQALLARCSGQGDVSVGTPIAGRRHVETEGLIGFFVNTLVLRGRMEDDPTFEELLGRARETALQAYAHQDLPFERLVDELAPRRDLANTPLFQAMLVLQNVARQGGLQAGGLELSSAGSEPGVAKFDLTLALAEGGEGLRGSFNYRSELFDATTVERLAERFVTLLEGAVADPQARLSDLPLLTPAERRQLLAAAEGAAIEIPEATLHSLIEEQAVRTPDAVAVMFEADSLTYRELDRRATALAHRLRARGVGPEERVGLCAERSLELVIGLLGILKAGGAWVPLDPGHPDARLALVIEDARFSVVLTQKHLEERLVALVGAGTCVMDLGAGAA
ncbi:MAG TPA: amino acid adenylation domain-containing protein, partial [Thermoanaerobaculia bacterium]|nr:amino acid adenylation domain-containing protein [Thermoanaerobaculia bacterium]